VGHEDNAAPDERPADGANRENGANGDGADGTTGTQGDALRASEQRFGREFGRAPLGVVAASLGAGRRWACLAVNDTYCELTGYPRAELDGTDLLGSFFPEDQPALEALIAGALSGATDKIGADGRLVRRDGELVWVHLTGSVIRPAAGERDDFDAVDALDSVEMLGAERTLSAESNFQDRIPYDAFSRIM